MKEILLKLEDSLLFLEKTNKDVSLRKYKNKYSIDITEEETKINYDESQIGLEHDLYNVLSLYLLEREVIKEVNRNKDKTKKKLKEMLKMILDDLYYSVILNLELERFFYSNNSLRENAFIDFNLTGLKDELKDAYKIIKENEENDKFVDSVQAELLKNGIDVKDYKELTLSYNEEEMIILSNKSGEEITPDNLYDKYRMQINADYDDDWLYDISFCTIVCLLFNTKVLYIAKEYADIYYDLVENDTLKEHGLKLVLC